MHHFSLRKELDERLILKDSSLLVDPRVIVEEVIQTPFGTQILPPGSQVVLRGESALEIQKNISQGSGERIK